MATERKQRLEKTVADLQQRFGLRAIGRAEARAVPAISTGFPALDGALGTGGVPRGRISEIVGVPTSGMATLALRIMAQAQQEATAHMIAYLDLEKTFDPEYATRCGVDLARLLLVRPYTVRQALGLLPDFAINGGFSVLVVDSPPRLLGDGQTAELLATTLGRIIAPLNRSGCALVFLSGLPPGDGRPPGDAAALLAAYPRHNSLPHYAAVRLLIQREQWLYEQRDIAGYEAQVVVVKNRLAAEGKQATIAITFEP